MKKNYSRTLILQQSSRVVTLEKAREGSLQIIDVRSRKEFLGGSIPGAVNMPLFDDDERGAIGTLYRHAGHMQAVDKGFEFVEKRFSDLIESFIPYRGKPIAIFCARGGMRSRSVVNLLEHYGYGAYQLEGGYKKYRHDVLKCLEKFRPGLIVIHGLTGTGKTRILQELDNTIDLEGLAQHRSSLFGAIDRVPRNQREFESLLVETIGFLGDAPYFIEGESRKIGPVFIPGPLALAMKEGICIRVNCSLETRIKRIIEDYPVADEKCLRQLEQILNSLRQKMGHSEVERLCGLLREGGLTELVRTLLIDYYDKRYSNCMSDYSYDLELSSEDISTAAAQLEKFRASLNSSSNPDMLP